MKPARIVRTAKLLMLGGMIIQFPGCMELPILDFVQTGLLGITAAGALAILQNI